MEIKVKPETKKFFHRLISAFLVMSLIIQPVLLRPEHKALAQEDLEIIQPVQPESITSTSDTGEITDTVKLQPLKDIQGEDPATNKSCIAMIGKEIKNLFTKAVSDTLEKKVADAVAAAEAVLTNDVAANLKLDMIDLKTTDIQTSVKAINAKQNCWDGVAKIITKKLT